MNTYESFEKEFNDIWNEYADAVNELDTYRGKKLSDQDVIVVNKILHRIQDRFTHIYDGINFVIQRYQFCAKAISDYNTFVDQIKSSGAVEANLIEEATS